MHTSGDVPIEGSDAIDKYKDAEKSKRTRSASKKEGAKMSPKVLETWINETL